MEIRALLNSMKCCFNWKVVAGLAVAGLAVWIAAPELIGRLLPTLVALICPLSMLAMMVGMGAMSRKEASSAPTRGQGSPAVGRENRLRQLELDRWRLQAEIDQVAAELRQRPSNARPSS